MAVNLPNEALNVRRRLAILRFHRLVNSLDPPGVRTEVMKVINPTNNTAPAPNAARIVLARTVISGFGVRDKFPPN
jgi:hypothetical protein